MTSSSELTVSVRELRVRELRVRKLMELRIRELGNLGKSHSCKSTVRSRLDASASHL